MGVLSIALRAREEGFKGVIVPVKNAREAAVVHSPDVCGMENLDDVVDFSNVRGQENVKRALEVAAAGGHNILMIVYLNVYYN
jgi:magnesium chelatase family protein